MENKKPDCFLTELLGTNDEVLQLYSDPNCPSEIINKKILEYSSLSSFDKIESVTLNKVMSIVSNLQLSREQISIFENFKHPGILRAAQEHYNSNWFRKEIFKKTLIHLNPFFVLFKNTELPSKIQEGAILSGGAVASLFILSRNFKKELYSVASSNFNDFDFFFYNKENLFFIINFLKDLTKLEQEDLQDFSLSFKETSIGIDIILNNSQSNVIKGVLKNNPEASIIFTKNAVTIKLPNNQKYQIITKIFNEDPNLIVNSFDFEHCKLQINLKTQDFIASQKSVMSILSNSLKYCPSINPNSLNAFFRYIKFIKRGWKQSKAVELLILIDIFKNINFNDVNQIKEGLRGFYFEERAPELFQDNVQSIDDIQKILNSLNS